ncbi:Oidioi.mRNA.OKI2018_I69.chr2.g6639.t1.cds [Oikopleura dioica]|uniref:Oidioi.mRNA.OKI2018_I69.chr2.g6639.t1.cds n=1 Tax=Oikopleura dioica TaxID=34765 RepID=A0ABN7T5Z9_OIKDI|nr:Oidioi.mRNA.OKI2018_I69.chr2.g6639.t1.cds [Oikopleura dioica]
MLVNVLLLSAALGDSISFNRGLNNARTHSFRMYHSQLDEGWPVFPKVTVHCDNNCDEELMSYLGRFMIVNKVDEPKDLEKVRRRLSYVNYLGGA